MHASVAVEEKELLRSIPAARVALIGRIARAASGVRGRSPLQQRFLRAYFYGVAEEDLAERAPKHLARAALAHLEFGARRPPGRTLVQVFNPEADRDGFESAHTLVFTVTDDMPFLVDSLGMAFARAELAVHLIVHPVLQVRRDRRGQLIDIGGNGAEAAHPESWQLYEIDRVSEPAQFARLQRDLEATLSDVRDAVADWTAMRERARDIITRLESDPPPLPAAEVSEAHHLLDWMEGRHFVFLGYRHYRLERGRSEDRLVPDASSGLGILRPRRRRASVSIVRGVVNLYERRTVRLLVRRDPYHRFYSCLVYVPRDRYNTEVRQRIEQIAREGFAGESVESHAQISGSSHARVHVVVRTDPAQRHRADLAAIERRIAEAALTWADRLREVLAERRGEAAALALAGRYRQAFPLAYQDDVAPAEALADIDRLESLRQSPRVLQLNLHRPPGQRRERVHLKIVRLGDPVPISDVLPMLENFGLRVIAERPYELAWPEGGSAWIQDFELEHRDAVAIDIARIEANFREAFAAAWSGAVENDGFNRLLLGAELTAPQVVVLRAFCRYLLQTGVPFSQASMERALGANPGIARNLVRLFEARFQPAAARSRGGGPRGAETLAAQIRSGLDGVSSLDEDRILRAYLTLVQAMLRTNFYQQGADGAPKSYLSFKLDPAKIPDLPLPRPKFEIFVYSPRVEGVHLRMGYVARGGLRWSDRREDFRTEILGLMKAQNVKNTLIVPVGAKGGFVVKRPPAGKGEDVQAEVVACYQTFIRGLLDLTDNILAGRIVPPPRLVRHDGDDPYLVVAADKGTATFSDIANAISAEYGFWLSDAFASGGSAGYDHKKMGITARGGWECGDRHFRELGIDTQKMDFTVVGVGDMSGDVFGNGMLLSRHIRLQAAFDHRHIFIDPDPDPAASFAERARLFALPRSSWDDYDRRKLSRGGGIFARTAKSIALPAEARALLGLEAASATPNEIMRSILRAPVDLLWNGGIGTYVKAQDERNAEVGDRANDALRINGRELRAKVVGEGGNLGLTQRGRVEYALAGGRLNTDFIDNSPGVNTSDVEVNIKILLNPLVAERKLSRSDRNRLLSRQTSEVAALVLRNNYLQSQALSTLEAQSAARLPEFQHLIRR